MGMKKVLVLMVLVTALVLALAPSVQAQDVEEVWDYDGDYDDEIEVYVDATTKADPGDDIEVTVSGEAQDDLENVTMDFWIEGSSEEGDERWESDGEEVLYRDDLEDGDDFDEEFEFEIPVDTDYGMVLGHITCEWDYPIDTDEFEEHSFDIVFPMTYVLGAISEEDFEELQDDYNDLQDDYTTLITQRDSLQNDLNTLQNDHDSLTATYNSLKSSHDSLQTEYTNLSSSYDDLQVDYNSLNSEHNSLQADYDSLESSYEAATAYTTYTYILAATTVIFVITTIIFATRKSSSI